MPRPPNNDPAVLLERANKERERWRRSQETYLERPENAKAHREVMNAYYQANKERLKAKANERNAEKRKAEEAVKKAAAERTREEAERALMEANDVNAIVPEPKKIRGRKAKVAAEPVVEIPKNEFVQEHTGLVDLLTEGSKDGAKVKRKLKKEAVKQATELAQETAPAPAAAAPKQKRKYVKSGKFIGKFKKKNPE
jgi:hypothetical protein